MSDLNDSENRFNKWFRVRSMSYMLKGGKTDLISCWNEQEEYWSKRYEELKAALEQIASHDRPCSESGSERISVFECAAIARQALKSVEEKI